MRKLLTSKKEHEKRNTGTGHTRQPRKQPIQQPKLTITSNWCTRNDSSNVSGILHPDKYLTTPRKLQDSKYEKTSNNIKGVQKKCYLSGNNCYCRYKTIKPKLSSNTPKKRISQENFDENLSRTCLEDFFESSKAAPETTRHYNSINSQYIHGAPEPTQHPVYSTYLNEAYDQDSESKISKSTKSSVSSYVNFTQKEKDYEAFKQRQNDYYNLIEDYLNQEEAEEEKGDLHNNSVLTLMKSKPVESQKGSSLYSQEPQEPSPSIEELKKFRDDHYFETHNVDNLARDIPEHVCVHQFQLDDRLLPKPVNVDPYGVSCCKICNQPMEDENLSEGSNVKKLLKYSKLGLSPRRISVAGNKSKIELKLKMKELEQYNGFVGKIRRPEYVNTFALRQQKMMC